MNTDGGGFNRSKRREQSRNREIFIFYTWNWLDLVGITRNKDGARVNLAWPCGLGECTILPPPQLLRSCFHFPFALLSLFFL